MFEFPKSQAVIEEHSKRCSLLIARISPKRNSQGSSFSDDVRWNVVVQDTNIVVIVSSDVESRVVSLVERRSFQGSSVSKHVGYPAEGGGVPSPEGLANARR